MTSPREGRERELDAPEQRRGRVPADTLSNRLTLARKLAGLSIREAADLCSYGRGAWTNWERGARPLDLLEMTGVIAEKLDVDLDWLRFGGPLEGPRGKPTRPSTDRPSSLIGEYRPLTTGPRPVTVRPITDRGNVRPDRNVSNRPSERSRRPVRV